MGFIVRKLFSTNAALLFASLQQVHPPQVDVVLVTFLLGNGLLDVDTLPVHLVVALLDDLVHKVIVVLPRVQVVLIFRLITNNSEEI